MSAAGADPLEGDPKAAAIKKLFEGSTFEFALRKVSTVTPNLETITPRLRSQYSLTRLKLRPELLDGTSSDSSSSSSSDLYEATFERKIPGVSVAKEMVHVALEFDGNRCCIAFCGHDLEIRVDDYTTQFTERLSSIIGHHVSMLVEEQRLLRPGGAGIHKFVKKEVDKLAAEDRAKQQQEEKKRKHEQELIDELARLEEEDRQKAQTTEHTGDDLNYFEGMGILSVPLILVHVFDAADEDVEGILKHCDVLRLLEASLCAGKVFGVTTWDVRLILATAEEDENGLIAYIPWLRGIGDIYENIRIRRAEYIKRFPHRQIETLDPADLPPYLSHLKLMEAIELLQGEELSETAKTLIDACTQQDPTNSGFVKRATLTNILRTKGERVSNQEARILMQLVEETVVDDEEERVLVCYGRLRETLMQMRIEKILNPVLESDIKVIRKEIVLLVRKEHLEEICPIWTWRAILMKLDKLLLSRFQIHILLCVLPMDANGNIEVALALQICVTMIERFFNPETMYETATKLQAQLEAEAKEKELRELQEMSGQKRSKSKEEEAGYIDLALRDNKDEVEKNLQVLFQSVDEEKKGSIGMSQFIRLLYGDWEVSLAGGGLTDAEKRGLIGECPAIKEEGFTDNKIYYAQHVKTWVPLLFEFRKNTFYKKLLEVDNVFRSAERPEGLIPLLDLGALEKELPLFGGLFGKKGGVRKRRNSKQVTNSKERRASMEKGGAGSKSHAMGSKSQPAGRQFGIRGPASKR